MAVIKHNGVKKKPRPTPIPAKEAVRAESTKTPEPKVEQVAPAKSNANLFAGFAIAAMLVFALFIAVCAEAGSSTPASTMNSNVAKPATTTTAPSPSAEQIARNREEALAREEAEMAGKLPYEGMDANRWIDKTVLGPHDEVKDTVENMRVGHGPYYQDVPTKTWTWYSKNGKHEVIFTVEATLDGKVICARKGHSTSNYWIDGQVGPNPYASGDIVYAEGTGGRHVSTPRPDPADYDDPEDYIDDLRAWQKSNGNTSTRYDDPYDDWELNH